MQAMAEEKPRSFDLKSWQGLTEVLKAARESRLEPTALAEFRNDVVRYAQLKGTDPELKKKIDTVINRFTHVAEPVAKEEVVRAPKPEIPPQPVRVSVTPSQGRRVTPQFATTYTADTTPKEVPLTKVVVEASIPEPMVEELASHEAVVQEPAPFVEPKVEEPVIEAAPVPAPAEEKPAPAQEASLRSIEEHRARIMEIKRRVISLVGNPISIVDHGNTIGRTYMKALLNSLKATSPGSPMDVEDAMADLENAFASIMEYSAHPHDETTAPTVTAIPESIPEPEVPEVTEEEVDVDVAPSAEPVAVEEPQILESTITEPAPQIPEEIERAVPPTAETVAVAEEAPEPEPTIPPPLTLTPEEAAKWSEEGGDADLKTQIETLKEELKAHEVGVRSGAVHTKRPIIPSLVDLEGGTDSYIEEISPSHDEVHKTDDDELSTKSLTQSPLSNTTGITLGTPQTELIAPAVTAVLGEILHEWSIFSSSGLFGMGPSGFEHPLYLKISHLPMGEVLSGRFEGGDMKLVHVIKDYVDAWRHEQGVAYNPTETFEHYLRRVAQRILKRQNGG
jgi:hypothetical protein